MMERKRKFTLLELLIVIAIIAIPGRASAARAELGAGVGKKDQLHLQSQADRHGGDAVCGNLRRVHRAAMNNNASGMSWGQSLYHWDFAYGTRFMNAALRVSESTFREAYGPSWKPFHCPRTM